MAPAWKDVELGLGKCQSMFDTIGSLREFEEYPRLECNTLIAFKVVWETTYTQIEIKALHCIWPEI